MSATIQDPPMSVEEPVPSTFGEQAIGDESGTDMQSVVEVFHESTKHWPTSMPEVSYPITLFLSDPRLIERASRGFNGNPLLRRVALGEPAAPSSAPFGEVIHKRVSTREFSPQPIDADVLSSILHHALRSNRTVRSNSVNASFYFRPYPSGGGLYPIEHYVVALRVSGLSPCVAHYDAHNHQLALVREDLAPEEFLTLLAAAEGVRDAAFAIVSTAVFQRSIAKYGTRGYRFTLLEAGCAAQTVALSTAAHGLACVFWGGYWDDKLSRLCGADGVNESVVSLLFVGHQKQGNTDDKSIASAPAAH
jgi:SagB-type dehydrogenase family enzyme